MNIISLFISATQNYPEKIALIEKEKSITYGALHDEVKATALYFKEKGIRPGDRVLVFVPVSADLYRVVLALFYIGATAVFLDEWVSKERMEVCCKLARCRGFVSSLKIRILSYLSKDLRKIPVKLSLTGRTDSKTQDSFHEMSEEDTALITFTTGSTGIPKAANRTHKLLKAQFDALLPLLNPSSVEIDLTMLPIVLLLNLGTGKTSLIPDFNSRKPKKFKPNNILTQIQQNHASVLTASPYFLIQLAKEMLESHITLSSIKKIFTGGAPVFPMEAALLQKAFPAATITIVYGSTEAEPVSHISAMELMARDVECGMMKGLSVGSVEKGTTVINIIPILPEPIGAKTREEFEKLSLPVNSIGEICVTGNHVLKSYIDNSEAVKMNKINVGDNVWHRTGDAGFINEGKELFLVGRCKQIIFWLDMVYYPFLVEDFCKRQSGVVLGTLILLDMPTLVLEVDEKFDKIIFIEIAKECGLDFPVKIVRNIPRDPRHFSKIDYDSVNKLFK